MSFPKLGPGESVEVTEVTAEVGIRLCGLTSELIDWLVKRTANPKEGFIVLELVRQALQNRHGFKAVVMTDQIGES